ncbi:NADP-dependent oxidoreductase [Rheinheimera riviphila]|uniref:NADP-dependent oxidoreductase n=1 Tax=Rheinheimera riviphila TaxID=1834037 RepID=UPI00197DDC65|nr:NADP-dependent oxidoreductase [Rheinheimera riviphila]
MKAWFIGSYGGPEVLKFGQATEPVAGDHDVLVEIKAASVNPIDIRVRKGQLKRLVKYSFPLVMGTDLAGIVIAKGAAVSRFQVGDAVYARPNRRRIGTFAERIAVHESEVALKPTSLSFEEAAAMPLVALTSLQAMVDLANIQPGQKVLIHAGAGGIGTFAVQLAKHLGAYVVATASKPKHALVLSLGANEVIDYQQQDFSQMLEDFDMVFDTLGGDTLLNSFRVLRQGGMVVSVAGPPDLILAREWPMPLYLRLGIRAISWKVRYVARKYQCGYRFMLMRPCGLQLAQISALIDAGVIRPVIDRIYPFERVNEAIAYAETGRASGKIIVSHQSEC